MRPVPGWLFPPLFFAGIAILLAGGVQWQVGRKQRTNFNDQVYIEDSSLGKGSTNHPGHIITPKIVHQSWLG